MSRPSVLRSRTFSSHLASRILVVVGAASLAVACEPSIAHYMHDPSGVGESGGAGTTDGSGGTGGTTTTGTPTVPPQGMDCFDWAADAGPCPSDVGVAIFYFNEDTCKDGGPSSKVEVKDIVSGPMTNPGQCCYVVDYELCIAGGRPYLVGAEARQAPPLRRDTGWSREAAVRPCLDGLGAEDRAALAAAWTADALAEHASVASFSRSSLALLAAGAPADLVAPAHQAALDEVRHAQICFSLATAYAGEDVSPGPFPTGDRVDPGAGLSALAVATVHEGCVGETVAAVVAAEQASRAVDPAVRAALAEIARDEARHAELAWRTVAWAIEVGGHEVREAVARAFREALARPRTGGVDTAGERAPSPAMEAHGRLDPATTARVVAAAMDGVVAPSARALLGRSEGEDAVAAAPPAMVASRSAT